MPKINRSTVLNTMVGGVLASLAVGSLVYFSGRLMTLPLIGPAFAGLAGMREAPAQTQEKKGLLGLGFLGL